MRRRVVQSSASIVLGVVTGVLVNLATDGGGVPVVAALIAATVIWVLINALQDRGPASRAAVRQHARGSVIRDTSVRTVGSGTVDVKATGGSLIEGGRVDVADASVVQRATRRARIIDADLVADSDRETRRPELGGPSDAT